MSAEYTPWFRMDQKPVREGEYEAREKGSRLRLVVHWKRLQDTPKAGWYFAKGALGPFNLWEDASSKITSWRGQTKPSKGQP